MFSNGLLTQKYDKSTESYDINIFVIVFIDMLFVRKLSKAAVFFLSGMNYTGTIQKC